MAPTSDNHPMTHDADHPTAPPEDRLVAETDLAEADAADAPAIAEALADKLERELEAIETKTPDGDG